MTFLLLDGWHCHNILENPRNSSGGTLHLPFSAVGESAFVGRVSEHDLCHLALTTTEVDSFNVTVVRCALFGGGRAERKGSIRIPKLLKLSPSTCWEWKKGESPESWYLTASCIDSNLSLGSLFSWVAWARSILFSKLQW